ncbi:MAG: GIY-YIG nuclease family protein [Venatoribacter sp.]
MSIDLLIPFGISYAAAEIIEPEDVPRGRAYNCPCCEMPLLARHHFAHDSSHPKAKKSVIEDFVGYSKVLLSKKKLEIIIAQNIISWTTALSNALGIYLITDTNTGKLYVGSATGEGGIWQRWSDYAGNGHGGNRDLQALLSEKGNVYSNYFQYSILEIADTHASINDVLIRESYQKDVLCSRKHGYNAN